MSVRKGKNLQESESLSAAGEIVEVRSYPVIPSVL